MTDADTSQRISAEPVHAQRLAALERLTSDHATALTALDRHRERSETRWGLDAETVGAAWTLEAWVKGTGSGLQTVLVRRVDVGAWSGPYVAAVLGLSSAQLRVAVGLQGGGDVTGSTTGSLAQNTWHHLAGTWDGTTLSGYINGALATAVSASGTIATNSSGRWGLGQIPQGGGGASEPYAGQIQGARVYSTCLTADEVLRRYSRGVGMWRGTP